MKFSDVPARSLRLLPAARPAERCLSDSLLNNDMIVKRIYGFKFPWSSDG
jgi:hypothetical protein